MKCKNCEKKEATQYSKYTSGEFCSRQCARSYSTKKNRKQISEKISKSLKSDASYECDSCGCGIQKNNKYCKKCYKYYRRKKLYGKLDIEETNLQKANQKAVDLLYEEYHINDLSYLDIQEKYNILLRSINMFFKSNDIESRSFSKSIRMAFKKGKLVPNNKSMFHNGAHEDWQGNEWYLRSSYEFLAANILDNLEIEYEVETMRVTYDDNGTERTYIPDFYLPNFNLVIETKSSYFVEQDNVKAKQKAIIDGGYSFLLLTTPEQIEEQLGNMNI